MRFLATCVTFGTAIPIPRIPRSLVSLQGESSMRKLAIAVTVALGLAVNASAHDTELVNGPPILNMQPFLDPSGAIATFNTAGRFDTSNAFFRTDIGTNGRSCQSCHQADQAMSISPPQVRARFRQTRGRDPLFAA